MRIQMAMVAGCMAVLALAGCGESGNDITSAANPGEALVGAVVDGNVSALRDVLNENPQAATATDREGKTLLHHAAAASQVEVAELLLEFGADPNAVDASGETVQDVADRWRASREFQNLLRDAGAY